MIKTLFNIYANKDINQEYMLLPPDYRPNTDHSDDVAQCCIDYIAGMMDTYAIAEYTRLTGISFDDINISKIPDVLDLNKTIENKEKNVVHLACLVVVEIDNRIAIG